MDDHESADEIQRRMQQLRRRLQRQAVHAASDARELISVRRLIAKHPLTTGGLAVGLAWALLARRRTAVGAHNTLGYRLDATGMPITSPPPRSGLVQKIARSVAAYGISLAIKKIQKTLAPIAAAQLAAWHGQAPCQSNGHHSVAESFKGRT